MIRHGSFLIVCLSLMILMVILSFSALHEIRLQVQSSSGNQQYLLAEAAAQSGLNHALEQILTDYNQTTMSVRHAGTPTSMTVPAITFLDGQYRAPFNAIFSPNTSSMDWDWQTQVLDNDVRGEDYVLRPWAWWWFELGGWWNSGMGMYDGKGRYYEPNYYNASMTPAGTAGYPVVPTLFKDPNAPVPERSQGVFYDDQFCRINTGNPQLDRQNARYRLRYTVGVEDLSGHLLINPMPDMQMITMPGPNPPAVDYRNPEVRFPWMTAAKNALAASFGGSTSPQSGAQLETVFEGRGYQTNVDLDHTPAGVSGFPKTFPLEYRNHTDANGNGPGAWTSYIDSEFNGGLTTNLYWSSTGSPTGLAAGGEPIPNWSWQDGTNFWPYSSNVINHCLMGPQLSFDNATYASIGGRAYLGAQDGGGGQNFTKFGITPFGRCLTSTGYNPLAPNKWYQGRVDTPFYLNLMTAPPAIVCSILLGYLPPKEKLFQYTSCSWHQYTGVDANGNRTYSVAFSAPIDGTQACNEGSYYGRDLLVDTTAPPAFAPWPAPDRSDNNPPGANNPPNAQGQSIKPDYYAIDVRDPIKTYPGAFMNGSSSTKGQGGDDLGLNMNELNLGGGLDVYDGQPFVNLQAGWPQHSLSDWGADLQNDLAQARNWTGGVAPPAGNAWGQSPNDYLQKSPDPHQVLHTYSYYFDMLNAMAVAISVFRAQYMQYDNTWVAAKSVFGPGDPTPELYVGLRDLDRLFLAEMGESIDAPGTGLPKALMAQGKLKAYQIHYGQQVPAFTADFIPSNNILSLVQQDLLKNADGSVTSNQRGHIMELMLNDFRMSFLGSSPGYSDVLDPVTHQPNPSLEFRPLDFDGDGMAYCSCYSNLDADGLPCAAAGTKPPTYFTITGNFFLGKSHFYRVFSRGEVWDNLLNIKLNDATLDSVLTVDPDGANPTQSQFLYQRWFYNRFLAMLPHVQR